MEMDLNAFEAGQPTAAINPITTPAIRNLKRRRPYRGSMEDESMEESINELTQIKLQETTSPTTKRIVTVVVDVFHNLQEMKEDGAPSSAFAQKQRELLRSEQILADVFTKDAKYENLSISYEKMVNDGKILNLGDYHTANLSVFKMVARQVVAEKNNGKKKSNHFQNPLDDKFWHQILEEVDSEREALQSWKNARASFIVSKLVPPPPQILTHFLRTVCARCPRTWSLEQLLFEISEYRDRNQIAHSGIEEWVESAKEDKSPESEKWKNVGQYILRDREMITQGKCPTHLIEKKFQILESLMIYQDYHFQVLVPGTDPTTAKDMPSECIPASRFFPKIDNDEDVNVRQRILSFQPYTDYEKDLKGRYLEAYEKVQKCIQGVKGSNSEAAKAVKANKKAALELKWIEGGFLAHEKLLKKYPREE
jgi:hypothetical protein